MMKAEDIKEWIQTFETLREAARTLRGVGEKTMEIYAVFVYCTVPGYESRWIDTQWAVAAKAEERAAELGRLFRGFSVPQHSAAIVRLSVVDTVITRTQAPDASQQGSGAKPPERSGK
jgi:hypothetical protein